jgi:hypothetical protein
MGALKIIGSTLTVLLLFLTVYLLLGAYLGIIA